MLFNSYNFLFGFLPICLLVASLLARLRHREPYLWWLVIASVTFYGWQNLTLMGIFLSSIVVNHLFSRRLMRREDRHKFVVLTLAVIANLFFLGYFKYLNFFVNSANAVLGTDWAFGKIALPLGISFYTFQQIAYLVDVYRGEVTEHKFLEYSLFVTFFPQLIAGPIVHHREILSQFASPKRFRLNSADAAVGMTLFTVGLFKKVVIADSLAPFASVIYQMAQEKREIHWAAAWMGAIAFSLQLYFDFSGYSDMALGLGRLFSIRLPLNFDSPYKSASIVEFWRRWHITLSHFLRDYLYIPLGGSQRGRIRRYMNLMLTMLLGGLWHGAGWTFVIWGGIHGALLVINHWWDSRVKKRIDPQQHPVWRIWLGRVTTFLIVTIAWVFFRAESLSAALHLLGSMFGLIGHSAIFGEVLWRRLRDAPGWIASGLFIVWFLPNTQELMGRVRPALGYRFYPTTTSTYGKILTWLQWRPSLPVAVWYSGLLFVSLCSLSRLSEFIYFNF